MNPPTALIAVRALCLRFQTPGYASVNVAKHWEPAEFNAFMNQVKAAAITARKALDSKDEAESRKLWRQIFGSTFGQ